jgi:hypothetical protein
MSSISFELHRGRKVTHTFTMKDSAGANVVVAADDVVRLKIGRLGSTPILDLGSDGASANGSTVETDNPFEVVFAAADVTLLKAGVYSVEILVVDNSESGDPPKHAEWGVCTVHETMSGEVGL